MCHIRYLSTFQSESDLLKEAGCTEKIWEYHERDGEVYAYKYTLGANGTLLGRGVCLSNTYNCYHAPGAKATIVHSTMKSQHVREIDSKKKTISVDFTLRMRWLDPRIETDKEKVQNGKGISLSPSAVDKIWTPDLHIQNRSSFQITNEWYSVANARIMSSYETNQIMSNEGEDGTGVELTYDVKVSVHCPFEYSYYPMDKQICMVGFGSRNSETHFVLYDRNKRYHNTSHYKESKFHINVQFLNLALRDSVMIGMNISMTRLTKSYLMEYYMPCIGIILVSEIGFVVPVTAIPGRIGLLVTQFLTLTNLFIHQMVIIKQLLIYTFKILFISKTLPLCMYIYLYHICL